jgi:hypothetical protein
MTATRRSLISTLTAASLAVSACAPKDTAEVPATPPSPNVVNVRATDFALELPPQIPAGFTTFRLANGGPNLHHMIIARIDSGKTYADAKAALEKPGMPPMWLVPVGGPNAAEAAGESNSTLDIQPGEYVVFCVVDIPGGVPHVAKGMLGQLTVTPATGVTAAAPTADITMTLADYSFQLSTPLTAGKHTIAVVTAPGQPHEVELFRLAPGKTLEDFGKDMGALMGGKPMSGPMAATAVGGTAPAVAGITQYFDVDLTPGDYILMCFMPDAKDGRPHREHGMVQVVKVS